MIFDMQSSGVAAAGEVLTGLLTSRTSYRRKWGQFEKRKRSEKISYAAVSQVVANYLWREGLKKDTDVDLPRRLKDRIKRALDGTKATQETLMWIMEAFAFSEEDKETVWSTLSAALPQENESDGITFTLRNPKPPMNRTQRHRTMALFKLYHIGDDRMLQRADAHHIIMALEAGLAVYGHSPRDFLKDLQCISGGKNVIFYDSVPGFVGMDIELERPLAKHQTASLQYVATYHPTPEPCTEVRRAARARIRNVDMRVCFAGPRPRQAWWCVWEDYIDGLPLRSEPVAINAAGELHRFIPFLEQTVVGFRWEW